MSCSFCVCAALSLVVVWCSLLNHPSAASHWSCWYCDSSSVSLPLVVLLFSSLQLLPLPSLAVSCLQAAAASPPDSSDCARGPSVSSLSSSSGSSLLPVPLPWCLLHASFPAAVPAPAAGWPRSLLAAPR